MSSDRVRLIPFVLVVLASLLPVVARAQTRCCSCNGYGTNCSACFYVVDQTALCGGFNTGSIRYCGCASEATGDGDGDGDGGGVGCSRLSSRTTVMGLDRGGAKLADHQFGSGLLNPGERRDGTFNVSVYRPFSRFEGWEASCRHSWTIEETCPFSKGMV